MGGYSISSLSVADDMVLLSFYGKGLQTLMDIRQAVRGQAEREWQCRVSSHVNFDGFSCIKPVLLKLCELWVLGRNVRNLQHHCVASIHIICRLYSDNFIKSCKLCKYDTININIIEHLFAS